MEKNNQPRFKPGCSGKIPYLSHAEARLALRQFRHKIGSGKIYRCPYLLEGIEHWHTSSMSANTYKHLVKSVKGTRNYIQA